MTLSPLGRAILESLEEFRAVAYPDSGGVMTAGFGHTGPDVIQGTVCSLDQADLWLQTDLGRAERAVTASLVPTLSQHQFDALVLFTFNVGVNAEAHSTLVQRINSGDGLSSADEFLRWNKINGVPNAGLTKRRRLERALFLDGVTL